MLRLIFAKASFGSSCNARRKASAPSLYLNCSSSATPRLLARYASSFEVVWLSGPANECGKKARTMTREMPITRQLAFNRLDISVAILILIELQRLGEKAGYHRSKLFTDRPGC